MAVKTKVKTYCNGEPITLGNCDGCDVLYINGHKSHEIGCPYAWKDYQAECQNCGSAFYPEFDGQKFCNNHCYADYYNLPCDCDNCIQFAIELQDS
jgi:hypothetical protein